MDPSQNSKKFLRLNTVFIIALFRIASNFKTPQSLSTREWITPLWNIHTTEYYLVIKERMDYEYEHQHEGISKWHARSKQSVPSKKTGLYVDEVQGHVKRTSTERRLLETWDSGVEINCQVGQGDMSTLSLGWCVDYMSVWKLSKVTELNNQPMFTLWWFY